MKNSTSVQKIKLLLCTAILLVCFQNCGEQPLSFSDSSVSDSRNFFNYKYTSEPPFYFDQKVIPQEEFGNYRDLIIVGGITTVQSSSSSFDYEIHVLDKDGVTLCPVITDTLSAGETLFEEVCISLKQKTPTRVITKIKFNNTWYEFSEDLSY